jgi:SAM-dependent methyltransferase
MNTPETSTSLDAAAASFVLPAVLFAANELRVFDAIASEGSTADEVARAVRAEALPVDLLLNTLASLGLVEKRDGRFALDAEQSRALRRGDASMQARLDELQAQAAQWMQLAAVARREVVTPAYYDAMIHSPRAAGYLSPIASFNSPYAAPMLDALGDALAGLRASLDVGGGHGGYSRAVLERFPEARATVYDLAHSLAYGRALTEEHPARDRMDYVVGDARDLSLEPRFDLVMVNDMLHYMDAGEKRDVLRRALAAVRPGGVIAAAKPRLDDDAVSPQSSALFSLRMFVHTRSSWLETDAETARILREVGARDVTVMPLDDVKSVVWGRR